MLFSQVFIENTGDDTYALWGANANPQVGRQGQFTIKESMTERFVSLCPASLGVIYCNIYIYYHHITVPFIPKVTRGGTIHLRGVRRSTLHHTPCPLEDILFKDCVAINPGIMRPKWYGNCVATYGHLTFFGPKFQ